MSKLAEILGYPPSTEEISATEHLSELSKKLNSLAQDQAKDDISR